ncbi:hypothetical protein I7I48_01892 [Histoplasma ohiense]|nr:hypothetical protein I7I48_01892 [Histoplasma ohiense (nom. inval.)]
MGLSIHVAFCLSFLLLLRFRLPFIPFSIAMNWLPQRWLEAFFLASGPSFPCAKNRVLRAQARGKGKQRGCAGMFGREAHPKKKEEEAPAASSVFLSWLHGNRNRKTTGPWLSYTIMDGGESLPRA